MTANGWLVFVLVIQVIHFLGTWKLYVKAGRKAWEALVPVYNAVVLMKIINRQKWWVILLFIPIINLMMFPVIWVETIRSFGRNSRPETFLVILTLGFYIFYVNYFLDVQYIQDRSTKPRSSAGEWVSSIVFAIIAATLVHTYFMQPFTIPTSSLEKSLLVGDFLFVSKFHYGARTPMTTVAVPMVHDTVPGLGIKSYLYDDNPETAKTSWKNKLQLPYFRFPGLQQIKHNDIVVFNWPVDTVRYFFVKEKRAYLKPIDKKSNYVKRAVGLPGDSLEIRGGYVYINGEQIKLPDRAKPQYHYLLETKTPVNARFRKAYDITEYSTENLFKYKKDLWDNPEIQKYINDLRKKRMAYLSEYDRDSVFVYLKGDIAQNELLKLKMDYEQSVLIINTTEKAAEEIAKDSNTISIKKDLSPKGEASNVFPNVFSLGWNQDNYGPIYIPEKGKTVALTRETLPFYKRIITVYEHNALKVDGDTIYINGQPANSYTFKQDYYWMMGDNRHNSEDSRYWGYVPYDHVVGKPVFIWMSWDKNGKGLNKIRWDRVFTTVGGDGNPVSYFKYFLMALAAWFVYDYLRKRKKLAK